MEQLPGDLFPPDLKQAAITLLGRPALAAILLKQLPVKAVPAAFPADYPPGTALLHPHEIERLGNYRLAKRRAEFLAGRICAKMALEGLWTSTGQGLPQPLNKIEIANDPSGRPIVSPYGLEDRPRPEISITHGGEYAAALVADFPCGIDIQQQRDNLVRVREKYCSSDELQLLTELFPDAEPLHRLCLLWTAKEAAKKALSYRQMPGFLELEMMLPTKHLPHCHFLTLAVLVRDKPRIPDAVTVLVTTFLNYGLAICILSKEQCYA